MKIHVFENTIENLVRPAELDNIAEFIPSFIVYRGTIKARISFGVYPLPDLNLSVWWKQIETGT